MKESELKPGQVAVNSHGCILVASEVDGRPAVAVFDKDGKWLGGTYVLSAEKEVTPLGPVTNLDDLPDKVGRYEIGYGGSVYTSKTGPMVYLSSVMEALTDRCLTRSEGEDTKWREEKAGLIRRLQHARRKNRNYRKCVKDLNRSVEKNSVLSQLQAHRIIQRGNWVNEEREKVKQLQEERDTLTARVAELEGQLKERNIECQDKATHLANELREVKNLRSELATLREQQTLGELLTHGQMIDLPKAEKVLWCNRDGNWKLSRRGDLMGVGGYRYYRFIPPVLPVLPEPEPSVPVPKVPKNVKDGIFTAIYPKLAGDYTRGDIIEVCESVCNCPELIAALSGEGANE